MYRTQTLAANTPRRRRGIVEACYGSLNVRETALMCKKIDITINKIDINIASRTNTSPKTTFRVSRRPNSL